MYLRYNMSTVKLFTDCCFVIQKRIQILELTEKRGLLWILEEESTYSGANEITFLEKLKQIHGEPDDFGNSYKLNSTVITYYR